MIVQLSCGDILQILVSETRPSEVENYDFAAHMFSAKRGVNAHVDEREKHATRRDLCSFSSSSNHVIGALSATWEKPTRLPVVTSIGIEHILLEQSISYADRAPTYTTSILTLSDMWLDPALSEGRKRPAFTTCIH